MQARLGWATMCYAMEELGGSNLSLEKKNCQPISVGCCYAAWNYCFLASRADMIHGFKAKGALPSGGTWWGVVGATRHVVSESLDRGENR